MIELSEKTKQLLQDLNKFSSETYFHALRVKSLTLLMINHINENVEKKFSHKEIDYICKGALLHDIGKLFVKNVVLTKKSSLSVQEKNAIECHTVKGYEAIKDELTEEECKIVSEICLYHHDRIDGKGENGLTVIPFYVQIVSICDAYDALVSDRIYREALSKELAVEMIESGKCGAFSKQLISYLKAII